MANKGLPTQRREPPFLINEERLHLQMDKYSVTLAKNMHVQLLESICRACFDIISITTDFLSMSKAYMDHIEKGVHTFPMPGHDRVFNIEYTLGIGRIPGVSILDSECYEIWLQF